MMYIIIGLVVALILIVVIISAIQQHKEKIEQEKRAKVSKQRAIIDETEELIIGSALLPNNPTINAILNLRSLNAAKQIMIDMPEVKGGKNKVQEFETRYKAAQELATNSTASTDEQFNLPDNEQQLVQILQCIKKLRIVLKSEQAKGSIDAQAFMVEDTKLDAFQLKINVESLMKRGNAAYGKEMLGSARQYYEKAQQTLNNHGATNEYVVSKRAEVEGKLHEISSHLKDSNATDRAKKAKDEEDELDMLFQPKKKW